MDAIQKEIVLRYLICIAINCGLLDQCKTQLLKFRQRRAGGSRVCLTGVRSTGTVRRPRPQLYHIDKPGTGELWYKHRLNHKPPVPGLFSVCIALCPGLRLLRVLRAVVNNNPRASGPPIMLQKMIWEVGHFG